MPFNLVCPASRGLSLALSRALITRSPYPLVATARTNVTDLKELILSGLDVPGDRVTVLQVDVTDEDTLRFAAKSLKEKFRSDYLNLLVSSPGILYPERSPKDISKDHVMHTLSTNLLGPMLIIKHFSPFLPRKSFSVERPSVWVNISARVGSIEDNRLGGWYSYRATKAGVNQLTRTLDLHLKSVCANNAFAISMHPGTVKTDLSKEFWSHVPERKLFEPEYAAEKLLDIVGRLDDSNRGGFYDWRGEKVPW